LGEHNIGNATGAAALAHGLGVGLAAISRGLERARPFAMRMQVESWKGIGIINDAYNANPASMVSAVKTLARMGGAGERIAVLGDMFELGKDSRRQHRKLGKEVAGAGIDGLYLLGNQAKEVQRGALQSGMPAERVVVAGQHRALAELLRSRAKKGDWLLFKGSRGMKMEKVIEELKKGRAE
jgi:UDP-N-acetylmuramoyl-tripeptide--D-alanyl-D-alanine ligase